MRKLAILDLKSPVLKLEKNKIMRKLIILMFNLIVFCFAQEANYISFLNNAFEEKGQGFGFTRFGKPFPVRIDNQFFSDEIGLKSFKTLDNLRYSDHVPIIGTYSWKQD